MFKKRTKNTYEIRKITAVFSKLSFSCWFSSFCLHKRGAGSDSKALTAVQQSNHSHSRLGVWFHPKLHPVGCLVGFDPQPVDLSQTKNVQKPMQTFPKNTKKYQKYKKHQQQTPKNTETNETKKPKTKNSSTKKNAFETAFVLAAQSSSVSPYKERRSEWPTKTYLREVKKEKGKKGRTACFLAAMFFYCCCCCFFAGYFSYAYLLPFLFLLLEEIRLTVFLFVFFHCCLCFTPIYHCSSGVNCCDQVDSCYMLLPIFCAFIFCFHYCYCFNLILFKDMFLSRCLAFLLPSFFLSRTVLFSSALPLFFF